MVTEEIEEKKTDAAAAPKGVPQGGASSSSSPRETSDEVSTKGKEQPIELKGEKLEVAAEAESTDPKAEKTLEEKKKALLERAAKLKGKVDVASTEELKEQVKIKKREDMLIPLEEYVKAGIYLGTRVVTPDMKPFVYRRRADGLAIFNTDLIDEKLKEAVEYLAKFDAKDIIVICKRQAGWEAVQRFSEITGIRAFTKKYPAGILTNTALPDFFENELTIISDAWLDKNALNDTLNVQKKVLMICDTNNFSKKTDQIIIGNNKSPKSLGVIYYLLAKGYCKAKGIEADIPDLEVWTGEVGEDKIREKISLSEKNAEFGV
jgi:small subunit ribosomal protein S2